MNISLRSTCTCWWHPRGLNLKDVCLVFRKFSELLVKMTTCSKVWRTLSMVTGRFANESVRQRMKSIRQRRSVSSPTPLNNTEPLLPLHAYQLFIWKAITVLCGCLLLFYVVSSLCVVITTLCCVVSPLCVAVTSLLRLLTRPNDKSYGFLYLAANRIVCFRHFVVFNHRGRDGTGTHLKTGLTSS